MKKKRIKKLKKKRLINCLQSKKQEINLKNLIKVNLILSNVKFSQQNLITYIISYNLNILERKKTPTKVKKPIKGEKMK